MNSTTKRIAIVLTPLVLLFAFRQKIGLKDKMQYFVDSILTFTPLALFFSVINHWYDDNKLFASSLITVLFVNMLVGAYFHYKQGTFDVSDFFKKNIEMTFYTGVVYVALFTLHINVEDDLESKIFLSIIEVISLLYPVSKICKNVFILSDGKHPPEFVMQKLYNFEKNGDLNEFFNTKNKLD